MCEGWSCKSPCCSTCHSRCSWTCQYDSGWMCQCASGLAYPRRCCSTCKVRLAGRACCAAAGRASMWVAGRARCAVLGLPVHEWVAMPIKAWAATAGFLTTEPTSAVDVHADDGATDVCTVGLPPTCTLMTAAKNGGTARRLHKGRHRTSTRARVKKYMKEWILPSPWPLIATLRNKTVMHDHVID